VIDALTGDAGTDIFFLANLFQVKIAELKEENPESTRLGCLILGV